VQIAVEGQKVGLQAVACGAVDCYQDMKTILGKIAVYNKALNQALTALNTLSAKTALANMVQVIQDWLAANLIRLPENVKPFVVVALQSLSAGLAAANISLGG
jgi:prophage DNA circulation protein